MVHIYQFPGSKRINLDLVQRKLFFSNCIHNMTSFLHRQPIRHTSTSIAIHQHTQALDSEAHYRNKTNPAAPKAPAWFAAAPPSTVKRCLSVPSPCTWTTHSPTQPSRTKLAVAAPAPSSPRTCPHPAAWPRRRLCQDLLRVLPPLRTRRCWLRVSLRPQRS